MSIWTKIRSFFGNSEPKEKKTGELEAVVETVGPSEEDDLTVEIVELEEETDAVPAEDPDIEVEILELSGPEDRALPEDGKTVNFSECVMENVSESDVAGQSRMTDEYKQWLECQQKEKTDEQI